MNPAPSEFLFGKIEVAGQAKGNFGSALPDRIFDADQGKTLRMAIVSTGISEERRAQ